MSANWSLTYLQTALSERELFERVVELFRSELAGRLYGFTPNADPQTSPPNPTTVEWFETPKRAQMIVDALLNERYSQGVMLYPQHNGLFTFVDSVIGASEVLNCSRSRRAELAEILKRRPDPEAEALFHYMDFLSRLTATINAEAVHIIFERNPAGGATGVHFYDAGQLVDEFYAEYLDSDTYVPLIELPQRPEIVGRLLGGRFAFLLDQPRRSMYGDGDPEVEMYFDGEDLGRHNLEYDPFNLSNSGLYVPFWNDMLPVGAVYARHGGFPAHFLSRYENPLLNI